MPSRDEVLAYRRGVDDMLAQFKLTARNRVTEVEQAAADLKALQPVPPNGEAEAQYRTGVWYRWAHGQLHRQGRYRGSWIIVNWGNETSSPAFLRFVADLKEKAGVNS